MNSDLFYNGKGRPSTSSGTGALYIPAENATRYPPLWSPRMGRIDNCRIEFPLNLFPFYASEPWSHDSVTRINYIMDLILIIFSFIYSF